MNTPETFKTNHPTIKEIRIGDKLKRKNGNNAIFTNIEIDKGKTYFIIGSFYYNTHLLFVGQEYSNNFGMHIEGSNALIKLKDKIKMI